MFKIKTASRLAIIVSLILAGNLWLAIMFRIAPQGVDGQAAARARQAQALSVTAAKLAETGRLSSFRDVLDQIVSHDPDLVSAGLRRPSGECRFEVGEHARAWQPGLRSARQLSVAIVANGQAWGTLEFCYGTKTGARSWLMSLLVYPTGFVLFVTASTCLLSWMMFTRIFRYLDPSKVVPGRVRSALDTLAEGLVLIDPGENIVHANEAFGRMMGVDSSALIGSRLDQYQWSDPQQVGTLILPWATALQAGGVRNSVLLELPGDGETSKYLVNTNPIAGESGHGCRGALISFDDVTQLERKKQDLAATIDSLRTSRDEIRKQNEQLKFLAARDPMTRCFNRRSFWELFEGHWKQDTPNLLNVLMIDIDHFKSINDNFGHSKGDEVLRETGAMLLHLVGNRGIVCRFGGEEFAVLLPGLELARATEVADAIHQAFQRCQMGGLAVTASIGLSNRQFNAMDSQHLLDQADQCLYAAKRNGRNRVIRFDRMHELGAAAGPGKNQKAVLQERIPYTTVAALFSVVARRDPRQAAKDQQLADLCIAASHALLDRRQLYWVESSALLRNCDNIVSSPDTRQRPRNGQTANGETCFQRHLSAAEFLFGVLGDCEPVRIIDVLDGCPKLNLVEAGDPDHARWIRECVQVLAVCRAWQEAVSAGGPASASPDGIVQSLRNRFPDPLSQQLIAGLETNGPAAASPFPSKAIIEPAVVPVVARHYAELNTAMALRQRDRLGKAVARMREELPDESGQWIGPLLDGLERTAAERDPDFGKLALVIDQLLDICRDSRRCLVEMAQHSGPAGPAAGPTTEHQPSESGPLATLA